MRLLTFSLLKKYKIKLSSAYQLTRQYVETSQIELEHKPAEGDPGLVQVSDTWPAGEQEALRAAVLRDMTVLPGFVSEQEEALLLTELEPVLRRMRYEFDHWDNAIEGYRETERGAWRAENEAVVQRVRRAAFPPAAPLLPRLHVLDLAPAGHIKPHVDAVRFCGDTIAGLCLSSSAVMRLQHAQHPHLALAALLPRRCLYIMRGVARYEFTHAVPGGADSTFGGQRVRRLRRVALIMRSRPPPPPPATAPPALPASEDPASAPAPAATPR